jgi:hypothetical protein
MGHFQHSRYDPKHDTFEGAKLLDVQKRLKQGRAAGLSESSSDADLKSISDDSCLPCTELRQFLAVMESNESVIIKRSEAWADLQNGSEYIKLKKTFSRLGLSISIANIKKVLAAINKKPPIVSKKLEVVQSAIKHLTLIQKLPFVSGVAGAQEQQQPQQRAANSDIATTAAAAQHAAAASAPAAEQQSNQPLL